MESWLLLVELNPNFDPRAMLVIFMASPDLFIPALESVTDKSVGITAYRLLSFTAATIVRTIGLSSSIMASDIFLSFEPGSLSFISRAIYLKIFSI